MSLFCVLSWFYYFLRCEPVSKDIFIMSLSNLPIELLEILFLYVSVDSLINAWTAVRGVGSNNFWRKVCKKQGFKQLTNVNEDWRAAFQRNMNWANNNFVKRKFKLDKCFDPNNTHSGFNNTQNQCNSVIFGESLLMNGHGNVQLWNLRNEPILMQHLPLNKFRPSKSKLVTINSSVLNVYSMVDSVFNEPTTFLLEFANILENHWCFTDMYFAIFDPKMLLLKIIYLEDFGSINVVVSTEKVMFFSLMIKGDYLFMFLLEFGQYKIKVFNLKDEGWLEDLCLFQGSAMVSVPKLEIGSKFVVSWCYSLENYEISPLKIWSIQDGRFKLVISEQNFYCNEELKPVTDILWLTIKSDYIIFSTSKTNITVWHSANPKHCKVMTKTDESYLTQKVVSNTLLVLLYSYCFKIIDFTKLICLHEICFDDNKDTDLSLKSSLLISNLFLIILEEEKDACEMLAENCYTNVECSQDKTASKEKGLQPLPTCKYSYTLSMYDFRAQ